MESVACLFRRAAMLSVNTHLLDDPGACWVDTLQSRLYAVAARGPGFLTLAVPSVRVELVSAFACALGRRRSLESTFILLPLQLKHPRRLFRWPRRSSLGTRRPALIVPIPVGVGDDSEDEATELLCTTGTGAAAVCCSPE